MGEDMTHYTRDDDLEPLCGEGKDGDFMSFFDEDVTCSGCKEKLDG